MEFVTAIAIVAIVAIYIGTMYLVFTVVMGIASSLRDIAEAARIFTYKHKNGG